MRAVPSISRASAAAIGVTCTLVLAGWLFGVESLKSFAPGAISMKVVTTMTFAALAVAIAFAEGRSRAWRRIAVVAAVIVLSLSTLSLLQYAYGLDLRIDRILIRDAAADGETVHPGRMAPNTVAAFPCIAAALLLTRSRRRGPNAIAAILLMVAFILIAQVLVGYLYDSRALRGSVRYSPMSLPAALNFTFAMIGVLALRIDRWPFNLAAARTSGGDMLRILLPFAVVVPVVAGALRLYGERKGVYDTAEGVGIFALFNIFSIAAVVMWAGSRLHRADLARQRVARTLQRALAAQQAISGATLRVHEVKALVLEHVQALVESDEASIVPPGHGLEVTTENTASLPLAYDGKSIAVLIIRRDERPFTKEEKEAVELIATSSAAALAHASDFEAAAAAAREQEAEIATLQQQFTAFMENIPAAAFIKDAQGHYIFVNHAVERLLGRAGDEILGGTDDEILSMDVAARIRGDEEEVLRKRTTTSETTQMFDDHDAPWWLILRFPIADAGGRQFLGGIGIDITDVKRAQEQITELNEQLEVRVADRTAELARANRDLESFTYSISHDLRAPLRAVDGYARLLEEDHAATLDAEGNRFISVIRSEAKRMAALIDDLLAFSRLGRQSLNLEMIDLGAMASDIMDEIRRSAPDRVVELTTRAAPPALADRATIRQVLVNLLTNAVKYAKPEGVIRVEFSGEQKDGFNRYLVRDEGIGFDMRYVDKLFRVFQRLHGDGIEGTGVGLAIVERIVAMHGGEVGAEGEVDRGAAFHFTLPAPEAMSAATEKEMEEIRS